MIRVSEARPMSQLRRVYTWPLTSACAGMLCAEYNAFWAEHRAAVKNYVAAIRELVALDRERLSLERASFSHLARPKSNRSEPGRK